MQSSLQGKATWPVHDEVANARPVPQASHLLIATLSGSGVECWRHDMQGCLGPLLATARFSLEEYGTITSVREWLVVCRMYSGNAKVTVCITGALWVQGASARRHRLSVARSVQAEGAMPSSRCAISTAGNSMKGSESFGIIPIIRETSVLHVI